ncbi:polypeptide N-acetylgalactosaminyltransferase 11-like [Ostrea edulis]|uniref:polypeptide N-acetylgalactosaminyltransferase 11-like n=1 Tax=Ostrea edulis TaxID=37623 RepID=UPI0024AFBF5D|nr:polypeptide N-acetylgalactosaminyltransferase 11-like [Ostrea edulis]
MRRRFSLKCCLFGIGIPLTVWLTFNLVSWDLKLSANWNQPSGLKLRARKSLLVRKDKTNYSIEYRGNSPQFGGQCETISEVFNKALVKRYNSTVLNSLGIVSSPEDQKARDEGYQKYAFNELISNRIGFHRAIPDTRDPKCRGVSFPTIDLDASVIICFFNELPSALLRLVHSVLDRSPKQLLKEIILVDDSSTHDDLSCQIETYVNQHLQNVKFVRTPERQGLIRARVFGSHHASGKVLVFLDSHCEVNTDWLEPLLIRISQDPKTVVVPVIDIINHDTMEYQSSPLVKGGFNWGLHFRWDHLPANERNDPKLGAKPIPSPTMAGGLFAMKKSYFHQLGEYDVGMEIWGGENLEISFRIWMCGGRLEILPCSRVGHIFRKRRPYGNPIGGDTLMKNSLRVANVWMDEYKKYFLKQRPQAENVDYGDISDRLSLRKRLSCKSFQWYLQNIYPEQVVPGEDVKNSPPLPHHLPNKKKKPVVIKHGRLKHVASSLCVQSEKEVYTKKALLTLAVCDEKTLAGQKSQMWFETVDNELILAQMLCLDVESGTTNKSYARLMKCHGIQGSQAWTWTNKNGVSVLYNPASGRCLTLTSARPGGYLTLNLCTGTKKQEFTLS